MAHLYISAAHKSSGKTTVTTGICAALKARGIDVRPFKKGPDYIDPMWLAAGAGNPCYNLDYNTQTPEMMGRLFAAKSSGGDIAIVEGNKGLHDGMALDGSNSNAALAKFLSAPVVLVLDADGMTRGAAPILLGLKSFDPAVRVAGVILNRVGGDRHEEKLRAVIGAYTDVPVLGAVRTQPDRTLTERHLGLVPNVEDRDADAKIARLARLIAEQVDLDAVLAVARGAPDPGFAPAPAAARPTPDVTIAVARDSAFAFYYPDDLEALEAAGARLIFVNLLTDAALPEGIDGLVIGGGFPETHMAALSANAAMRKSVADAVNGGLPTYAECGGLMYLTRHLVWRGEEAPMAGVIAGDAIMHDRPRGRGYVRLKETAAMPWPGGAKDGGGTGFPAHEFHYSSLENLEGTPTYAYDVLRGFGVDGESDGLVQGNLLATYAHLRDVGGSGWTRRFVDFVRACRKKRKN